MAPPKLGRPFCLPCDGLTPELQETVFIPAPAMTPAKHGCSVPMELM